MRPQLLDRFGLSVNVTTLQDVPQRTQMVLDRMAYEADPDAFVATAAAAAAALKKKVAEARARLKSVRVPEALQVCVARALRVCV